MSIQFPIHKCTSLDLNNSVAPENGLQNLLSQKNKTFAHAEIGFFSSLQTYQKNCHKE